MSLLLDRTIELLDSTLIPMAKIAREVGCSAKAIEFLRKRRSVPNVILCEKIYNLLSRDPLEVK
jgi:DNA-binding XRE family transcriptional regulator